MSLFTSFLILFVPMTFGTLFVLRWFDLAYFYRNISIYWTGIGSSIVILLVLTALLAFMAYKIFLPFMKVTNRIKSGGEKASPEEVDKCLGTYRKINTLVIAMDLCGFFFGQIGVLFLDIQGGVFEYDLAACVLILLQSLGIASMTAAIEVVGINEIFAPYRRLLEIHTVESYEKHRAMRFSNLTFILFAVSVAYAIINMISVPFQLLNKGVEGALGIYLKDLVPAVVLSAAPCLVTGWILLHSFAGRIDTNFKRIHEIAEAGNLTSRLNLAMMDDYGALSGAINVLIKKLSIMFKELKNDTDVVAEQSDALSEVAETALDALVKMIGTFKRIDGDSKSRNSLIANAQKDVDALTEDARRVKAEVIEQTSAIEEASAAISQMSSNIESVASMTEKADEVSGELSRSSTEGNEAIMAAIKSIEQIQVVSHEVQDIVKVIQKIASQTNLLSMNAAIEAAHAGEQGEGFAVVAGEVRSLAASSSNAAKDIQLKIKDMVAKIDSGVESIGIAGRNFHEIAENVKETSALIRTIAAAMEEQKVGAGETLHTTSSLVEAVTSVKELAEHESERAENVRSVMQNVVKSSEEALALVNEGVAASDSLNSAIEQVNDSVQSNRKAVTSMKEAVKIFKV